MNSQPQVAKIGHKILTGVWEWVKAILLAVVIALIIRAFVFEFVRVDGASMMDTLTSNQFLFVTKYDYILGQPERGDIVICHYPGRTENFVKRLVGLPNEEISVVNGVVYINGTPLDQAFVTRPSRDNMPARTLGTDEYFVVGDNRANSHDSRAADVGALPRSMIAGHARAVIWFPFKLLGDT